MFLKEIFLMLSLFCSLALLAEPRIWRGGDVKQNHQAVFSANQFSDGTLRVWRGGDVRQNFQAAMTISDADQIPRGVLLFVITRLLKE